VSGPTVDSVKLDTLPTVRDARGALTVADFNKFVPFPVVRMFYVREVPPGTMRGQHAHYRCTQYMVCLSGRLQITVADGNSQRSFELAAGNGILIEPGIFATETYLDADSLMMALCDRPYEKEDYIHDMDELRRFRAGVKTS
jgi:UDP-2-acetamido-3-amino-2,3-dideoxy-glucuronate N-acetyltransferase